MDQLVIHFPRYYVEGNGENTPYIRRTGDKIYMACILYIQCLHATLYDDENCAKCQQPDAFIGSQCIQMFAQSIHYTVTMETQHILVGYELTEYDDAATSDTRSLINITAMEKADSHVY